MAAKSSDAIRERLARLQEAVPPNDRETQSSPDLNEGWIVVATARDGWKVEACREFVASQGIAARLESTGGNTLLVKQADFDAATAALQSNRKRLRLPPRGKNGPVIIAIFCAIVAALVIGMTVIIGRQLGGLVGIAISLGVLGLLGLLAVARLARR